MVRGVVPRQPAKTGRHEGAQNRAAGKVASKGSIAKGAAREFLKTDRTARRVARPGVLSSAPRAGKSEKAKRYDSLAPERVAEIISRLDKQYPAVTCALTHRSAWELLVATILSAQSTDVGVNRVTPVIFAKYPTVQDFAALEPEQLQPDIRTTGFFRNKSKSVVGAARKIVSDFGGEVPDQMDQLLALPGVARKTANVVLGTWFKKNEGVVVDTHVTRISHRLELTKNTDAAKIEQDLMKIIPKEKWTLFSHQVIWHGRKLCIARRPNCVDCPLENICHADDKTWSTVDIHKNAK